MQSRLFKLLNSILYSPGSTLGRSRGIVVVGVLLGLTLLTTGCAMNLRDQPKYKPLEPSEFFENGTSARPLVANTIARGQLRVNTQLYEGRNDDGSYVADFPLDVTPELLARGREQYNIYCSPCHGFQGNGEGMIVQRGFKQPASFHSDRLREIQPGYFYDVITNGFGAMYSYAARVQPEDRWAIIAYIRALQLSQNATLSDVPPGERDNLLTGPEQ